MFVLTLVKNIPECQTRPLWKETIFTLIRVCHLVVTEGLDQIKLYRKCFKNTQISTEIIYRYLIVN